MKDKHITKSLLIAVGIILLLAVLCSSCCVYQDIKYSVNNWQMPDTEVEFYKPATVAVIRKSDRKREILR
jgi:hypothetical protein